jgi:threonyl-tRNA synthetase
MSEQNNVDHLRHSCAHLLAAAVLELYPNAKRTIGPSIENGFYYDFDFKGVKLSEDDLQKIEDKMYELVSSWQGFERKEISKDEALEYFNSNEYKQELINEFAGEGQALTLYTSGSFTDLCRGGHTDHPSEELKYFKLLSLAGAYWRGDENNKMLTRIYGTCFPTQEELDAHLTMLEEAKKRDHRKLGPELDLFHFSDLVGPGLPLFTEKGTVIREELTKFIWSLMKPYGYTKVTIPHIAKSDLYKVSGHWDKFADDIFHVRSQKTDQEFVMKPMNCPHHTQIFASRPRSYKELPIRMSEVTAVYRDENTGQLQGLSRVRSITQDDAHVFCRLDQVADEAKALYEIIQKFYKPFGMPLRVELSLSDPAHPEKYLGGAEVWERAEGQLRDLLNEIGVEFREVEGEAAFYGPKIDFKATDAIGRTWQLATIQLDFNLPERFELEYTNAEGEKVRPVMLHRAVLGSVERFMSVLIEHYAGNFPLWLSPEQVQFLPVSTEKHLAGTLQLAQEFADLDIRVEVDSADETVGNKIRKSAGQKIPYVVVCGDKELGGEDFMIRVRGEKDQVKMSKEAFVERVLGEIKERK